MHRVCNNFALAAASALGMAMACSVDDRVLKLAPEFSASMPGGGGNQAGGSGGSGGTPSGPGGAPSAQGGSRPTGGSGPNPMPAGMSGTGGMIAGPNCPNLNSNAILDCDETVIENAGFDTDTSGWQFDTNVEGEWLPGDAMERADSGTLAARLTLSSQANSGRIMQSAWQCVQVLPQTRYDAGAQVFIASGQGMGEGGISLWFYGSPDCTGQILSSNMSLKDITDRWTNIDMRATSPANAGSVRVRLTVLKPWPQPNLTVLFDNVLFAENTGF